ncbi:phage integrase Arm DNA-binding domain-containing protein [Edwardsiella ictaluri]|nr:phage integrase Arm DNA-binding domain-containing protein [Edwardsiella ictaluri]
MARQRNPKNRDLPPNLYERNGYYSYRNPANGKEFGLGKDRVAAISQAIEVNISLAGIPITLKQRIEMEKHVTVSQWRSQYMRICGARGLKQNSMKAKEAYTRIIDDNIGATLLRNVTVKDIARLVSRYTDAGKMRAAKIFRSVMVDFFREAIANGHVTTNVATVVRSPKATVLRSRMSLSDYLSILDQADKIAPEWVSRMLKAALITGQRQADLCNMDYGDIHDGKWHVRQSKTGAKIAIPLSLSIAGFSLSENVPDGGSGKVFGDGAENTKRIRHYFLRARCATGLSWDGNPPSFHEIRSLCARLYAEERGAEFAKKLLGHKSMVMTDLYRDERGGWVEL